MWVVLKFGINCSFFFGHATKSSFPFRDVLVMSDAVGGRLGGRKKINISIMIMLRAI